MITAQSMIVRRCEGGDMDEVFTRYSLNQMISQANPKPTPVSSSNFEKMSN